MDTINITETEEQLVLSWDSMDNVKYYLEGKSNYFNYELISILDNNEITLNKNDYKDYHKYRISYVDTSSDKDRIVKQIEDTSLINNGITSNSNINANINTKIIKSYQGYSLSLISDKVYDKYLVYKKDNNRYILILESDDFQITSSIFKENETYYAEAFINNVLAGKTDEFICHDEEINKTGNKLSVIIPAYNASLFLPRTLDSVILSSFDNLNITVVNDGSTDNTLEVCDWYKNKYSFINVVNKENTGVSETRNVGVKNVDGDYIAFLDSDDIVHPNMYSLLYDSAIKEYANVSIAKTLIRENDKEPSYVLNIKSDNNYLVYDYDKMFNEHIKNTFDNIYFVAVWNKIVKREIALKVRFPKSNYFEDSAYTPALYTYVDKFIFVPDALYIWDKRKRTTVGTYSSTYKSIKFEDSISYYLTATCYPLIHGDLSKREYVIYDVIRDLLNYFEKIKDSKDPGVVKYKAKLLTLINLFDMTNNRLVKEDKDLMNKIEFVLKG